MADHSGRGTAGGHLSIAAHRGRVLNGALDAAGPARRRGLGAGVVGCLLGTEPCGRRAGTGRAVVPTVEETIHAPAEGRVDAGTTMKLASRLMLWPEGAADGQPAWSWHPALPGTASETSELRRSRLLAAGQTRTTTGDDDSAVHLFGRDPVSSLTPAQRVSPRPLPRNRWKADP